MKNVAYALLSIILLNTSPAVAGYNNPVDDVVAIITLPITIADYVSGKTASEKLHNKKLTSRHTKESAIIQQKISAHQLNNNTVRKTSASTKRVWNKPQSR